MVGGAIVVVALIVGSIVLMASGDDGSSANSTEPDSTVAPVVADEPAAEAQQAEEDVATATETPAETVAITNIGVADGRYIVDYETFGYIEQLPGLHVHFYWNDIAEFEAGMGPYEEEWYVWGGPRPFDGYLVGDRSAEATEMCAVVANPDHTIITRTGNCMPLP